MDQKTPKEDDLSKLTDYHNNPGIPTRRNSEENHRIVPIPLSQEATRLMKSDINSFTKGLIEFGLTELTQLEFEPLLYSFNSWAEEVYLLRGEKPTRVEEFLEIDSFSEANLLIQKIRSDYNPESVPNLVLDMILLYRDSLGLTTQEAAKAIMRRLSGSFKRISKKIRDDQLKGNSLSEITSRIFKTELEVLRLNLSLLTKFELDVLSEPEAESTEQEILQISQEESVGLIEVYRLQRRPYNAEQLAIAQDLLKDPILIKSMLIMQILIARYAQKKLSEQPQRGLYTLEHLNSLFLSAHDQNGIMKIAPNPSFLATMVNNWLGAIASSLTPSSSEVKVELTGSHIAEGINKAEKEFSIFKMHIGRFSESENSTDVNLEGFMLRVCPANKVITDIGSDLLAHIYDVLKNDQLALK